MHKYIVIYSVEVRKERVPIYDSMREGGVLVCYM